MGLYQMALISPVTSHKAAYLVPIFLLYINDLPNLFKDSNAGWKMFANDVKLRCLPTQSHPQSAMDKVVQCSETWFVQGINKKINKKSQIKNNGWHESFKYLT